MATNKQFHCSVITPEREVLSEDAESVMFPAHDGEVGVLVDRAPFIFALGIGVLKIDGRERLMIDGGFAHMLGDELTLLTSNAMEPSEIKPAVASAALEQARAMPITDDASFAARQAAIRRAETQLAMASHGRAPAVS